MTFQSGISGNPSGRPAGSKNRRTQLARLLEPHAEELVSKVLELAKQGDIQALRLCIERLIPKATNEMVHIEVLNGPQELTSIGKEVINAVAIGNLAPRDGLIISGLLENQRKLVEHAELKNKLDQIEGRLKEIGFK